MSCVPLITEETLTEFTSLVAGGMQRKKAAEQVGFHVRSLRSACKRLGVPWPDRTLLTEQIKQFEAEILAGTISQHQIAKELGCSQAHVSTLYSKLGYPRLAVGNPCPDERTKQQRIEDCEKVLDHLETHGGYIISALRELGFPESFRIHVSAYAALIGFDPELYRFAHRTYGYWRTLPGKAKPIHTANYKLPAVCTKCGTEHEVDLINMKMGTSTQCINCAQEERKNKPCSRKCVCVETGETIPSTRKLSQKIDIPTSTVSYLFARDGYISHDGLTYRRAELH